MRAGPLHACLSLVAACPLCSQLTTLYKEDATLLATLQPVGVRSPALSCVAHSSALDDACWHVCAHTAIHTQCTQTVLLQSGSFLITSQAHCWAPRTSTPLTLSTPSHSDAWSNEGRLTGKPSPTTADAHACLAPLSLRCRAPSSHLAPCALPLLAQIFRGRSQIVTYFQSFLNAYPQVGLRAHIVSVTLLWRHAAD